MTGGGISPNNPAVYTPDLFRIAKGYPMICPLFNAIIVYFFPGKCFVNVFKVIY